MNWSPGRYEMLVANLLGQMHDGVQRIDGTGGDEGRDVIYKKGDRSDIYQLKSHTGRLTQGRRRNIKADIVRAAEHRPTAWFLVVPIDPTPGELRWFETVSEGQSFPCTWFGLNWLEARMSEHPELVRYALGDFNAKVVDLLKELQKEEAHIGSADDALDRLRSILGRLNEVDPFYTFAISSGGGSQSISVVPRYPDAAIDSPIGGTLSIHSDAPRAVEAADLLRDIVDFGTNATFGPDHGLSVSMDLPAGLGHDGPVESLTIAATPPGSSTPGAIRLLDMTDRVIAALPITITPMSVGQRGGVLHGTDRVGTLDLTLRLDAKDHKATLQWKTRIPTGVLPSDVLPVLMFLRAAEAGCVVQVVLDPDMELVRFTSTEPWPDLAEGVETVEALTRIQQATGTFFALPDELDRDTEFWIKSVDQLLRGDVVDIPWTHQQIEMGLAPEGRQRFLETLRESSNQFSFTQGDLKFEIDGNNISLGPGIVHIPSAIVANAQSAIDTIAAADDDTIIQITVNLTQADDSDQQPLQMWLTDRATSSETDAS